MSNRNNQRVPRKGRGRSGKSADTVESMESVSIPEPVSSATANSADVGDLLDVLVRQRGLIASIVLVALVAGTLGLSMVTPRYTASADVIIEGGRPTLATLEAVLPGLALDNQSIISETAVLRSRILLESVVERLRLSQDPEFNAALQPPGPVDRVRAWLGLDVQANAQATDNGAVVNALAGRLGVAQLPNSRVISVSVTSESPEKAAEITNTLVDEYLASQQRAKVLASSQTHSWLHTRIHDLRKELLDSEKRVEAFRSDADLLETRGATLISQQMADLNAQLIVARTATAAAEARLGQISELVGSPDDSGIYTVTEVLDSPMVQNLRQQQVVVERRIAELSAEFGPAHPTMIQLKADAADLDDQISIEVGKIAQGLRNEVAVARARESALERQVDSFTGKLSETNEDEIQLRALEREAEANRQLLETLLGRQKELGSPEESESLQSDARVISYADRPSSPSFPDKTFSLGIIFVMSVLSALVVAFIREVRRRGFLDLDQLEAATGLNALGFVPLISSRRRKRSILDSMVTNPNQPFAQALKAINWGLNELAPKPGKVILVTSAIAGEGKTTTAIGLARARALEGHKTLLIDADIRSPKVHEHVDKPRGPGLREVLEKGESVTDHIVYDKMSSLDVLTAGEASGDPLKWINSPQMQEIRTALTRKYDYIIIDSPPIVVAPDAVALSKLADTTVVVVRWWHTPADVLKYALRMLSRNGGHVTGAVMTMLDTKKQSDYSYGYYGAYGTYAEQAG